MSNRYNNEVSLLTGWFKNRIRKPVTMAEEDFLAGIDSAPEDVQKLAKEASEHWRKHRGYELSYSQLCSAFFDAIRKKKMLTLIPRHPVFRLNTLVVLDYLPISGGGRDDFVRDVPAKISGVKGDEHMIEPLVKIGNDDQPGRTCAFLQTSELEQHLQLLPLTTIFSSNHSFKWVRYNPESHVLSYHVYGYGTMEYRGLSDIFAIALLRANGPRTLEIMVRDHLEDAYWRRASGCTSKGDDLSLCCTDPDSVPEGNGKWIPPDE